MDIALLLGCRLPQWSCAWRRSLFIGTVRLSSSIEASLRRINKTMSSAWRRGMESRGVDADSTSAEKTSPGTPPRYVGIPHAKLSI